jgi:hypothetical protein
MRRIFFPLFFLLIFISASAQPRRPGPPPPDPGQPIPISGIEYLVAAGALWGGRQLLKKKNQKP